MGGWSAAKKMYETWKSLFHVVDLVVDLEMPDVPTTTAKKLRFTLTPHMVKTATELYLNNLKQLVISVFAHVRRKVLGQFDEARVAAEALVVDVDPAALCEATRSALQDPGQRRKIICENITAQIAGVLLDEMEAIVLPKASKMMSQVDKHTPPPPGIKSQLAMKSKRLMIDKKVLPDPGKVLTKTMMRSFKRTLPTFVRAIVTQQYGTSPDLAPQLVAPENGILVHSDSLDIGFDTAPPPGPGLIENSPRMQLLLHGSLVMCACTDDRDADATKELSAEC